MQNKNLTAVLAMLTGGLLLAGCGSIDIGAKTSVGNSQSIVLGADIAGSSNSVYGLRLNLFEPDSKFSVYGLETGTLGSGAVQGMQIGLLRNQALNGHGLQLGLVNENRDGTMMQIGGWNTANSGGMFQIGLFNQANNADGLQIGLLNESPNSWIKFMLLINVAVSKDSPEEAQPEFAGDVDPAEARSAEKEVEQMEKASADLDARAIALEQESGSF